MGIDFKRPRHIRGFRLGEVLIFDPSKKLVPVWEKTISGTMAHITDGADSVPLKSWGVTLPASLSGYSSVDVVQAGKNLFDDSKITPFNANVTVTRNGNEITVTNGNGYVVQFYYGSNFELKQGTYAISVRDNLSANLAIYVDVNGTFTWKATAISSGSKSGTFTLDKNYTVSLRINVPANGSMTIAETMIEVGNQATTYAPYSAETKTANLGRTIYGGSVDVVNGTGTDENGNDFTFTPITPTPETKLGVNNFWADGDSQVTYYGTSPVYKTVNGAIASFSDGADNTPLESLIFSAEPIQDLHGYSNPYPAGTGANKWDEEWEVGNIDTSGQPSSADDRIRSKNYIPVSAETSYYFVTPSVSWRIFCYDSNHDFISYIGTYTAPRTITTPANCAYLKFWVLVTTYENNIAVNYPSSVTDYSPYSNICPISGHTELTGVHCGKNMLPCGNADSQTVSQVSFSADGKGRYTVNGTASGGATAYFSLNNTYTIKDGDYLHIMNSVGLASASIGLRGNNTGIVSPAMSPANRIYNLSSYVGKTIDTISIYLSNGNTLNGTITPMILNSNTATDFEEYSSEMHKWTFPTFGKNLLNYSIYKRSSYPTYDANYVLTVESGKTYTFSCTSVTNATSWRFAIRLYDSDHNVLYTGNDLTSTILGANQSGSYYVETGNHTNLSFSFTMNVTCYATIFVLLGDTQNNTVAINAMLEQGSSATTYEPYQEMYSGSVNALTGACVSKQRKVSCSEVTGVYWNNKKAQQVDTYRNATFLIRMNNIFADTNSLCNRLEYARVTGGDGNIIGYTILPAYGIYFCVPLDMIGLSEATSSTADSVFLDAIRNYTDLYFVCDLATPITTTLDSVAWQTKLGNNNFYNDCEDTEVTYMVKWDDEV